MSFEEPNDPRSSKIGSNQIQLTELAMYEEQAPGHIFRKKNTNLPSNFSLLYIDVKHYFEVIYIYFPLFTKLIIRFLLLRHYIFISDKKKSFIF